MVNPVSPKKTYSTALPMKVLFVDVNEEDTSFLTKDVPVKVVHASAIRAMEQCLGEERFDALVMDLESFRAERVRNLKKLYETSVFLLADSLEVSRAVESVKQGADGFLLRKISKPYSFLQLAKHANHRS